jgi:P2-related tail formation protein
MEKDNNWFDNCQKYVCDKCKDKLVKQAKKIQEYGDSESWLKRKKSQAMATSIILKLCKTCRNSLRDNMQQIGMPNNLNKTIETNKIK